MQTKHAMRKQGTVSAKRSVRSRRWRREGWPWLALLVMSCAWAALLFWMEVQKYLSFHVGGDLGVYAQSVWSTAFGRPFYMSVLGGPGNFLGHHFAPLVAILAPLYRLWPDARLLLAAEVAALALAAIPLYVCARTRLGPATGLLIVLIYFLYPPLHFAALTDFHEIHLAVPLLMASTVSLVDRRFRTSILWLAIALLAKEEVAFIAIGFGVYISLVFRRWRLGLAVAAATLVWGILVLQVIIPALNAGGNYAFYGRYATLGSTPREMVHTLIFHPLTILRLMTEPDKLIFIAQVLLPLGCLPVIGAPIILLAIPTLVYLLLSDYSYMTSITFYYTAPLIPFLFVAVIVALQRLQAWKVRAYQLALVVLTVAVLISARLWSPLPGGNAYAPDIYKVTDADRAAGVLLNTIPPDASVASDGEYAAWVDSRFRVASIGGPGGVEIWPSTATEYLAVHALGRDAIISPMYPWVVQPEAGKPIRVPRYDLIERTAQGLALWKWRGAEHDVSLPRYDTDFELGLSLVAAGTPPEGPAWGQTVKVAAGSIVPIWMAWKATAPLDQRITFSLHLVDAQGKGVAQVDREMAEGHFPTTLWHRYETEPTVADEFPLEIPLSISPGRYRLLAGAFRTETVAALSRLDGGGQWVDLAEIEIAP